MQAESNQSHPSRAKVIREKPVDYFIQSCTANDTYDHVNAHESACWRHFLRPSIDTSDLNWSHKVDIELYLIFNEPLDVHDPLNGLFLVHCVGEKLIDQQVEVVEGADEDEQEWWTK